MMRLYPVIAVWMVACGVGYPAPEVSEVDPDRGWNGDDTVIAIHGSNFYPRVWVEAGGRDASRVDDDFAAFLVDQDGEEQELATTLVGYDELEAVVRPGLAPGRYDVLVESPTGDRGRLRDGFTVSDTVAAAIELRTEAGVSAAVHTPLSVDVLLVDNEGEEVAEAGLAVRFWLTDVAGSRVEATSFETDGMFAVSHPSTAGGDLTAVLGSQDNSLMLTMDDAGIYDLHAAPQRDASIAQASEGLEWLPAEVAPLEITLPGAPFVAQAGQPFDVDLRWYDIFGNPAPTYRAPVVLQDDCGNELLYDSQVEAPWTGSTKVSVTIRNLCAGPTFIRNNRDGGQSVAFTMTAGPPASIQVIEPIGPVVAGVPFTRNVFVQDSEGNGTEFTGSIALDATTGGLQSASCDPVVGGLPGEFSCTATPTVAAQAVRLSAVGTPGSVSGISSSFQVHANSAAIGDLDVTVDGPAVAGSPVDVRIQPIDDWGNPVSGFAFASDLVWSGTDELGEADCQWVGTTPADEALLECTMLTARAATLSMELLLAGIQVDAPVTVLNGALASALVTADGPDAGNPTLVTAGDPVRIVVTGWDAWGNPTTTLADPTLEIADDKGAMAAVSDDLDGTGRLSLTVPLTLAGNTVIRARQAGFELGASPGITVVPGLTDALDVTVVDAPWAWVGQPVDVRVEAVDGWDNRTGWSGTVDLASRRTVTAATQLTVTNGVGTRSFTWAGPALDEVLDAAGGGWTGASAPLDVATDCGAGGPQALVDFAGFPEAVACTDPVSGVAVANASMAATVPGTNALTRYDIAVEGGTVVRSASSGLTVELPGTGVHAIRALAMDSGGCGHEVGALGFAGPDDGAPVGPIELAPALGQLVAGVDATAVDLVDVTDCSRDLAVGASVRVRTTLGELTGATETGSGLSVDTDPGGDAQVTLDAVRVGTGGTATVHAWVPSGAARGTADVAITGDDERPTLWFQSPSGETLGSVGTVDLVFSEPMLTATLAPAAFDVSGPGNTSVNQVSVDPDGRGVTLDLAPAVDAGLGVWQVTVSDTVRDESGNRLSGDWSGLASPYIGFFGDIPAAVDPVSCLGVTPVERVIRPDGDPGGGEEADEFEVDLLAVVAPAWWEVSVQDSISAAVVYRTRSVPLGGSDSVTWDGRDQAGKVVDNGLYDVVVEPIDGQGNRGGGCQVDVTVDNALGGVP